MQVVDLVHGASSLELDGDYERVAPGLNVHDLIADVTRSSLARHRKGARRAVRSANRRPRRLHVDHAGCQLVTLSSEDATAERLD